MSGIINPCDNLKIIVRKDDKGRTELGFLRLYKETDLLGHTEYSLRISKSGTPAKFKFIEMGNLSPYLAPILAVDVRDENPRCEDITGQWYLFSGFSRSLEPLLKRTSEYNTSLFWTLFDQNLERATDFSYGELYYIVDDPNLTLSTRLGRATKSRYFLVEGRRIEIDELKFGLQLDPEVILLQFLAYDS